MKIKLSFVACLLFCSITFWGQMKSIDYKEGNHLLKGLVAKPLKPLKNKAGVLILPAWMGIDDHAKETANRLVALGYTAFIADIYGVGEQPKNFSEAAEKAGYYKKNIKEYQIRMPLKAPPLFIITK